MSADEKRNKPICGRCKKDEAIKIFWSLNPFWVCENCSDFLDLLSKIPDAINNWGRSI